MFINTKHNQKKEREDWAATSGFWSQFFDE
jgi:hypothetical protein